jgi:glutamate carboxypeptidase
MSTAADVDIAGLHAEMSASTDLMLADLETLVEMESPAGDAVRLDALADRIAGMFEPLGPQVLRRQVDGVGTHLELRFGTIGATSVPQPAPAPRPVLVLCHMDTVHPVGTLSRNPFRVDAGRAYGPGSVDMKAGIVLLRHALGAATRARAGVARPVTVLITADEEVGSKSSRSLIEQLASAAEYVLVLEAAGPEGAVKTSRKGIGWYSLDVTGRAAHSGLEPERGVSAVVEVARLALEVSALADHAVGTTVNVGVLRGGTGANVVAERATAELDVRFVSSGEAHRVDAAIGQLTVGPGAELSVSGGIDRMPLERTESVAGLYETARALAAEMGWQLGECSVGGASDGNITAGLGLPTLDGVGAAGAGLHTPDEYVEIDSLPRRAALIAGLLTGI